MPTRAGAKRKAPSATVPVVPPSSKQAKKHTTGNERHGKDTSSNTPVVGLARRFISSLAKQLASDSERDGTATATASLAEIGNVFIAALGALPKGKLKRELQRDEAATIRQLAAELGALNSSHTVSDAAAVTATSEALAQRRKGAKQGKGRRGGAARTIVEAGATAGGDDAVSEENVMEEVVPCTIQLYGVARERALRHSGRDSQHGQQQNSSPLRILALNPRAPLDLLVDAMWEASAGAQARAELLSFLEKKQAPRPAAGSVPIGITLPAAQERDAMDVDARPSSAAAAAVVTVKSAVDGMENVVKVLAADPSAAVSATGLAFFAHRAAVLSEAFRGGVSKELAGAATDRGRSRSRSAGGVNGVARSNEVGSMVTEALGLMLRILQVAELASSSAAPVASEGRALNDAAEKLLLPCVPETTRACSDGSAMVVPAARRSIARLLADYAVVLAACSAGWKGGAAALIKNARLWAAGGGDRDDSSSSSSSDEESDEEAGEGLGGARFAAKTEDNGALSRHLSTMCAAHLSGDEGATLEFLRCVGDACFVPPAEDQSGPHHQLLSSAAIGSSLARPCARALSRLPRPNGSPAPAATLFLKRAYAARVVEALGRTPACNTTITTLQKTTGHRATTTSTTTYGNDAARPWDFVGDAPAPRALLDFLGRPEAPVAVGDGEAGEALRTLATRRDSAAAVGELLRSSKACAPAGLGALLAAMERFGGAENGQESESGEGGGQGSNGQEDEVGGFFVDKDGSGDGGAGAGGGVVLPPRGVGGGVQDMDEEEHVSGGVEDAGSKGDEDEVVSEDSENEVSDDY